MVEVNECKQCAHARAEAEALRKENGRLHDDKASLMEDVLREGEKNFVLRSQLAEAVKAMEEAADEAHTASIWEPCMNDIGMRLQVEKPIEILKQALAKLRKDGT